MDNKGLEDDSYQEADVRINEAEEDEQNQPTPGGSKDIFQSTKQIWRNTLVLSIGFLFLFISFQALQALQSSLFIDEGMGTTALAAFYVSLIVSSLVLASPALSVFGCKWTLVIAMSSYVLYMVVHFYVAWETFVPAAITAGLGGALLWSAHGQYLNTAAHDYALKTGTTHDGATNLFFGIFFCFCQSTSIWGSIISGLVLSPSRGSNDSLVTPLTSEELSFCGSGFCPSDAHSSNNTNLGGASDSQIYKLAGIYTACGCLAVLLIIIFLQQLPTELGQGIRCTRDKCNPHLLLATFIQLKDPRQVLLIPLTIYNGLEQSFLAGDFTQAFLTCPLGNWWVGYILIFYGVCDAVCCFTFGRLVTCMGRQLFIILGGVITMSLLIAFLLFEVTQYQLYAYFVFAGLWGVADAVWQTQISALYGVLFKSSGEAAFSNLKMWVAVGFSIGFLMQSRLCLPVKVYVHMSVLVLGMMCYGLVELMEQRKKSD